WRSPGTTGAGRPTRLTPLLFEEREPRHQVLQACPRGFHPLAQRAILRLHLRHPGPELGIGARDGQRRSRGGLRPRARDRAGPRPMTGLRLRLEGACAPARELLRHMADGALELIERYRVKSFSA